MHVLRNFVTWQSFLYEKYFSCVHLINFNCTVPLGLLWRNDDKSSYFISEFNYNFYLIFALLKLILWSPDHLFA